MSPSAVFNWPLLNLILERCLDYRKIMASSGEMYYKGAFPGLAFVTHPELAGEAGIDLQDLKDMVEEYENGLQRFVAALGFDVKSLAPQVVDPSAQADLNVCDVAMAIDMPKRIFMGSERGELSSEQDTEEWDERIDGSRNNNRTPNVVVPVVDRLIMLGISPEPSEEGYYVSWPTPDRQKETDAADIFVKRMQGLVTYISGGGDNVIPPLYILIREMNYEPEEAQEILEAALEYLKENPERDLAKQAEEEEEFGDDEETDMDTEPEE
jgi:hypothetical protein